MSHGTPTLVVQDKSFHERCFRREGRRKVLRFSLADLFDAIVVTDADEVSLILASGDVRVNDADAFGSTPLHIASQTPNADNVVRLLLRSGAMRSLNDKDQNGNTPLLLAAQANLYETASLLIAAGANPSISNEFGQVPHMVTERVDLQRLLFHYAGV